MNLTQDEISNIIADLGLRYQQKGSQVGFMTTDGKKYEVLASFCFDLQRAIKNYVPRNDLVSPYDLGKVGKL